MFEIKDVLETTRMITEIILTCALLPWASAA